MAAGVLERPISADVNIDEADRPDNEKKQKKSRERAAGSGKGGGARIVVLIMILAVLGALVSVVGFNAFGLRDRYLLTTLRGLPLVSGLFTDAENGEAVADTAATVEELQKEISDLKRQLDQSKAAEQAAARRIEINNDTIERLQQFEDAQLEFKAQKEEFDRMIAMGDPTAYSKFYPSIAPENAEVLGPEAIATANAKKKAQNYYGTIAAMDEKKAAKALTELIRSDLDLVVSIIDMLPREFAGAVLDEMEPRDAAFVLKRWAP